MKIVCTRCRHLLGEKAPLDDDRHTHAMCDGCSASALAQGGEGRSTGEYLDRFEFPVLMLDGEGRVVAVNERMERLVGKNTRAILGYRGGEAMECRYAGLSEGCGETIHCATCTIRQTVMATHETGKPLQGIPATLLRDREHVHFVISTAKVGDLVLLTIESVEGVSAEQ